MHSTIEIVKAELIGKEAAIVDAKNRANIGIKGRIIDETRNTITIDTKSGKKRVIKQNITIEITHDNKKVRIDGKMLSAAPEERIKIKVK
jgi:ribonuclease P protein subunit POP4